MRRNAVQSKPGGKGLFRTGRVCATATAMTVLAAKIIYFLGLVAWVVIRYPFMRRARKMGVARSAGGTRDRVLLMIATFGQFLIPLLYIATGQPAFADYPLNPVQAGVGVIALVVSLVLFRVTHKQLGRMWSVTLEMRDQHKLVTSGLYGYVRHPMYSSFALFALAQLLILPNWIAGPAGLITFGILFFMRVPNEERVMIETFGDEYRHYMQHTARIIPWIY
jgi:protein-S-isoprenylcysteine O-methyltransferase Ste14